MSTTHTPTSSYVKREQDGRVGYVGPIRSPRQAEREAQAWRDSGWAAEVLPSTADVRRTVNTWQREARAARAFA